MFNPPKLEEIPKEYLVNCLDDVTFMKEFLDKYHEKELRETAGAWIGPCKSFCKCSHEHQLIVVTKKHNFVYYTDQPVACNDILALLEKIHMEARWLPEAGASPTITEEDVLEHLKT